MINSCIYACIYTCLYVFETDAQFTTANMFVFITDAQIKQGVALSTA